MVLFQYCSTLSYHFLSLLLMPYHRKNGRNIILNEQFVHKSDIAVSLMNMPMNRSRTKVLQNYYRMFRRL